MFQAHIEVVGHSKPSTFADFYVIRGANQALLCKNTSEDMKLLQVGVEVNALKLQTENRLKAEFPCIPGECIKLDIDNSVKPTRNPNWRIPLAFEDSVNEEFDQMEQLGIIEAAPETSEWMSPAEVIVQHSNKHRIVIDMRQANKAIRIAHHPMPEISKFHRRLSRSRYFTKLDLKSAYHHVLLHPKSRYITTFMTSKGPRRFTRLMFGMNTAPEIFQRIMESILRDCEGIVVYLDDILICAETLEELEIRTNKVLEALKRNNLTLNEEKCQYNLEEVDFLGFHLDKNGMRPSEDKIKAIKSFREPSNVAELRSFLGLATHLSPYIENYASLTEPLWKLLRKNNDFKWTQDQTSAFGRLKNIIENNIRAQGFFQMGEKTKLYTDASPFGLGAVLVQVRSDNKEQIVAFASKSLNDIERRYPQTQREAFAVVWAVEKFYYYLLGSKFTILTDHQALEFIYNGKYRDGKRAITRAEGWALRLDAYDFTIEYVKGEKNIADPLSRLATECEETFKEKNQMFEIANIDLRLNTLMSSTSALTLSEIKKETELDEEMKALIHSSKTGEWTKELQRYQAFEQEIHVTDGFILRGTRIILPKSLRLRAIKIAHIGHPGATTMKRTLRERVWWSGIDSDIDNFKKNCLGCTQVARDDPPEPMKRTELPQNPFDFIAIDFYTPKELGATVLVVTDYYSRYIFCIPITTNDTQRTCDALESIFFNFGNPVRMKADNGSPFQGADFQNWCEERAIKLVHSIPYWAQQNGQVERVMPNLTRALTIGKQEGKPWRQTIKEFTRAYNHHPHSVTGKTPANLMFNREVRFLLPNWSSEYYRFDDEMRDLDKTRKFNAKESEDQRRHAKESDIQVKDYVMIHSKETGKLKPNFDKAQYEVIEREGSALTLKGPDGNITKRNVAHVKKRPSEQNETQQPTESQ